LIQFSKLIPIRKNSILFWEQITPELSICTNHFVFPFHTLTLISHLIKLNYPQLKSIFSHMQNMSFHHIYFQLYMINCVIFECILIAFYVHAFLFSAKLINLIWSRAVTIETSELFKVYDFMLILLICNQMIIQLPRTKLCTKTFLLIS
jgi:hypothetical protein